MVRSGDIDIAVVGAGIGGMTLALALLQRGLRVRVFEQAQGLGEVGAGLSITPNAVKGLRLLGLDGFLHEVANRPLVQWTHHGETGEDLLRIDRTHCEEQYGAPYFQLHRADFHDELVRRCLELEPDLLQLDATVVAVSVDGVRPRLTLGDGTKIAAGAVVGADGVRSAVRRSVFGEDALEFTGQMAWRGLIPASDLPRWCVEAVSHNWIGPGRTFVTYPVRGETLVNVVAFARAESWVEESWSTPALPGEIHAAFAGWCDAVTTVVDTISDRECYRWGLFSRQPLTTLVRDSVVLIGDAAHPMLPFFGQGASSAIEDAVVLARCFEQAPSVADALSLYDAVRTARVTFLQSESNLGAARLQGIDPYMLRDQPPRNEDSLGIFRYDPTSVALQ